MPNILEIKNLSHHYQIRDASNVFRTRQLAALTEINLQIKRGEVLGLVGESGCGKSTLARCIIGLVNSYTGKINFQCNDSKSRRSIQLIFQDPIGSLNPRMTIEEAITEPLRYNQPHLTAEQLRNRTFEIIQQVGLSAEYAKYYSNILSGGQAQRVAIARALINQPELLLCDEPVSALDVSIRAQIINLLLSLQSKFDLSMLFISHDLSVVYHISNRTAIMYLGRIVEIVPSAKLFDDCKHPYSHALLAAIPRIDTSKRKGKGKGKGKYNGWIGHRSRLQGEPPSPFAIPTGCPFRTRCRHAQPKCGSSIPKLQRVASEHQVACHFWEEINEKNKLH